ncbi:MAG: substrate-binding domain-containing protein, partial [Actinomycetota bacterium]|nr:substrate-binding domain-containing protein [Actinomycetota bacterium]
GSEAAETLLSLVPQPTALVCLSDELALGAAEAIKKSGLSVPRDVSVVGFDNVPAAASTPGLTTVNQDHFEKGRAAARLLTEQMSGTVAPSTCILDARWSHEPRPALRLPEISGCSTGLASSEG